MKRSTFPLRAMICSMIGLLAGPLEDRPGEAAGLSRGTPMRGFKRLKGEDGPARKAVLIYYANDTPAPTFTPFFENLDDLRTLLKWVHLDDERQARMLQQAADSLRKDWNACNERVYKEKLMLTGHVAKPVYKGLALAVFQNGNNGTILANHRGNRDFRWETARPHGEVTFREMHIAIYNDMFLDVQPLSHRHVLRIALEAVRAEFPPEEHCYVLVVTSQGGPEMVTQPYLPVRVRGVAQRHDVRADDWRKPAPSDPVRAAFGRRIAEKVFSRDGGSRPSLYDLSLALLDLSGERPPGMTKREFLQEIALWDRGGDKKAGMYFPLVILNVPHGSLQESADLRKLAEIDGRIDFARLPVDNVGMVYAVDAGPAETMVPYEKVFTDARLAARYPSFVDAMRACLDEQADAKRASK